MTSDGTFQGWYHIHNSRKWHYFHNTYVSLCGRWFMLNIAEKDLEDDHHTSPDNCVVCNRKRLALANTRSKEPLTTHG